MLDDPRLVSIIAGIAVGYVVCSMLARTPVLWATALVLIGCGMAFIAWRHGTAALEDAVTRQVADLLSVSETFLFGALAGGLLSAVVARPNARIR